jgi:hypothetical protein
MSPVEKIMTKCITCGTELHPERAKKYNYCMAPDCQKKNLKGLTMVAVGVNKSAEQYMMLDDETKTELAEGKYHDQRRGTFGQPVAAPADPATENPETPGPATSRPAAPGPAASRPAESTPGPSSGAGAPGPAATRPAAPGAPVPGTRSSTARARQPWTRSQQKLALLYNQQGLRPEEIARKLGLSRYTVTQIILAGRGQGKL